jgi:hypothetical protein
MPLSSDLEVVADLLHELAHDADLARILIGLAFLSNALPEIVERARALEGQTVPPHWRIQPYDGQPRDNVTPLRGRP